MKLTLRRCLPALLLSCAGHFAYAEPDFMNYHRTVTYPSIGLAYQGLLMAELSLVRANNYAFLSFNYRLGAETSLQGNHPIVAPKAAGELCFIYAIFRLGVADYWQTNTGKHDFRFTPEAGITYPNIATLTYGYNVPMSGFQNKAVSGSRLSLTFCFDRKKIKNMARGMNGGDY